MPLLQIQASQCPHFLLEEAQPPESQVIPLCRLGRALCLYVEALHALAKIMQAGHGRQHQSSSHMRTCKQASFRDQRPTAHTYIYLFMSGSSHEEGAGLRLTSGKHNRVPEDVHGNGAEEIGGCTSQLCGCIQILGFCSTASQKLQAPAQLAISRSKLLQSYLLISQSCSNLCSLDQLFLFVYCQRCIQIM